MPGELRNVVGRGMQSGAAVAATLFAVWTLGDTGTAKLAAVLIVVLLEWGFASAPKRSAWIRRVLDRRSVFEGAWIQDVKRVVSGAVEPRSNRFAVFVVVYADARFSVHGTAYNAAGEVHSRWKSNDQVYFAPDGRSMSYMWKGTVQEEEGDDIDRSGFATLDLPVDDSGTGRVDHVSKQVTLIFDVKRVTPAIVGRWKRDAKPELLTAVDERDRFAADYAARLANDEA